MKSSLPVEKFVKEHSMEELVYQPTGEVKAEGNFVKNINFKPTVPIYVCIIAGVLICLVKGLLFKLLGAFFILMGLIVLFAIKDYKVMDIFDKGIMFYSDKNGQMASFVKYDLIASWKCDKDNANDRLVFTLQDGSRIERSTFQVNAAYNAINTYIPEKEENHIRRGKERAQTFDYHVLGEKLRNKMNKK